MTVVNVLDLSTKCTAGIIFIINVVVSPQTFKSAHPHADCNSAYLESILCLNEKYHSKNQDHGFSPNGLIHFEV